MGFFSKSPSRDGPQPGSRKLKTTQSISSLFGPPNVYDLDYSRSRVFPVYSTIPGSPSVNPATVSSAIIPSSGGGNRSRAGTRPSATVPCQALRTKDSRLLPRRRDLQQWSESIDHLADSAVNGAKSRLPARRLDRDVAESLDDVLTLIDCEKLRGDETKLFSCRREPSPYLNSITRHTASASPEHVATERGFSSRNQDKAKQDKVATSVLTEYYFSKVDAYANSRLELDLPPLSLYVPTWPILCLAAQYSQSVYDAPTSAESETHVSADWRAGTKAMRIKSVSMDHMNTIVFAIRGSATFMDWAVNLNSEPVSAEGFLDDPGNLCHAGFLSVAKRMVKPVASRLRQLLEENPSRSRYSLLITGHSAGGAVAALLYSHMLAFTREARSELNVLADRFKRIHCVTFGSPPITLLPLTKPDARHLRKSLFLSFVNEGDPVVRADKAYVGSLLELLSRPAPSNSSIGISQEKPATRKQRDGSSKKHRPVFENTEQHSSRPWWHVPPCTLSNAGRIVILRSGNVGARSGVRKNIRQRLEEGVIAVTCREDQLRQVVWGDPLSHLMNLYAGRIEMLAVAAVTAQVR